MPLTGFSNANHLKRAAAIAALPFVVMAWIRGTTGDPDAAIFQLGVDGSDNSRRGLEITGTRNISGSSVDGAGVSALATATVAAPASGWFHACAALVSNTSRAAYLNGAAKGTNVTSNAPAAPNVVYLGVQPALVATPFAGAMAHVSLWDATLLSSGQIDALALAGAAGAHPLGLHHDPGSPFRGLGIAYWALRASGDQRDLFDHGHTLTQVGALTVVQDEPPTLQTFRRGPFAAQQRFAA